MTRLAAAQQDTTRDPHTAQPERPTVATHAWTVAPAWVEVESGVEIDRLHGDRTVSTPTVLKIGLAPRVQLTVSESWIGNRVAGVRTSGMGDASVGVKWRLGEHVPVLGAFAVLPSLKLPTGSFARGTGTSTTDVGLLLISSHDFGAVSMDVNAGYSRRGGNGTRTPRDATLWTISAGAPLAGPLGWTAEVYGYPRTSGPAGNASIVALLTGPTAQLRPWLDVDAGVIVPLAGPQPRAVYAGAVWNIGKL